MNFNRRNVQLSCALILWGCLNGQGVAANPDSAGSAALPTHQQQPYSPGAGAGAKTPFAKKRPKGVSSEKSLSANLPQASAGNGPTQESQTPLRTILWGVLISFGVSLLVAYRIYEEPIARVNSVSLKRRQFRKKIAISVTRGEPNTPAHHQAILNDMILREAIAQDLNASTKQDRQKPSNIVRADQPESVLEIWFARHSQALAVSDDEVRSEYEKRHTLSQDKINANEYLLSQIIVNSEAEAKEIIRALNQGVSFAVLAQEHSTDQRSKYIGGMIGWGIPAQIIAPINQVVMGLSKGQFTKEPIATPLGWHIVRVEDVRLFTLLPYDKSYTSIFESLVHRKRQAMITQLISKCRVKRYENSHWLTRLIY